MDDQTAIRAVIERYLAAYDAKDSRGCAEVYADDAILLSPWSVPLIGRDAIAEGHLDLFAEGETNKSMTIRDLIVDRDTAVCLIGYAADIPGEGSRPAKVFGASLNSLRRQPDGAWKIRHTSLHELDREFGT
jgi:uncharacterized protein (TIGR02246 family)